MKFFRDNPHHRRATSPALALSLLMAGTFVLAQTPGTPAAAESSAPPSRIGPPVPAVPLSTTPARSTPLRSTTMSLPRTPTDPSGTTIPDLTPAPAPRG